MKEELSEEGEKTLAIDVTKNPRSWSVLAIAIIKQYERDKQNGIEDYIDDDWYQSLFELSTRYITIGIQNNEDKVDEIKNYYKTHSVLETCSRFGFTKNKLKYYLRSKGIKKEN